MVEMKKVLNNESRVLLTCAILLAVIFFIDSSTPSGYAGSFLYILPVFICLWSPKDRTMYWVALIATLLTILAVPLEPHGDISADLFNRSISLVGIWIVVLFGEQRRKGERETERYAQALARSNSELQQFAYLASHDLQEPLRMVTAYLGLLETKYGDQLDGDAKKYIDFAIEGGTRARDLIHDLLEFSRIDSQAQPFGPTDMEKVLEQVVTNLKIQIQDEHATITHDKLPTIFADDTQIASVLQNLISNAIKFHGDEEPKVHISCMDRGDRYLFSVKDNGIGIDTEYKDKVFVLFQRLHSRDSYEGTGIGLAIAKKVVERHGGRIWFESEVGKGTTFYFTIPKRD